MKLNKIMYFFLFLLILLPINIHALSKDYEDLVYGMLEKEQMEDKINIYFFYGDGCSHCAKEEKFLQTIEEMYGNECNIYMYETWYNEENVELMKNVKNVMNDPVNVAVPYTVIGKETYLGYNDYVGNKIENQINEYLGRVSEEEKATEKYKENIPLIGEIDKRDVSIGFVAIVLGLVDGFNPCAMWILLFLINMLIGMKDKRKMLIIGCVFLFTSAFMYFLFMLGISNILSFLSTRFIRALIGIIALIVGSYNVYKYFKELNEPSGCHVVNEEKRKKIFNRIKKFTKEKNMFLALGGVIILAVSVNAVELACSSVFPATFAEILAVNNVTGIPRIIYLLVYVLFYMIDDLIVFVIAVATLELSTTSSKYGKYSRLIGGIIMFIIGLLLIIKPEWLMLNF